MLATFFRYVGDFFNIWNQSSTSWIGQQHIWSPTSVTNIDVTVLHILLQKRVAKAGIDSYFEKKIIIQEENDKILEKSPFLEVL